METVATRKALGRKRMMAEDDEAKGAASMGWMEVEKEVLHSLETQKVLAKEGLEKKTTNSSETLVKATFGRDWEDDEWAAWKANFEETEETTTIPEVKREESMEEWEMRRQEREKADLEITGGDYEAWLASEFRRDWNYVWSRGYGSFEDTTRILPMRFTYKPAPQYRAYPLETLQIFSAKVAATRGGLQWPLDVFGMVAMRDNIDHNRNIIFYRTRDNCQTLTKEDPNLVLVGPTRAVVVLSPHPVIIEVDLKVKGTTESEDKDLSFLAVPFICGYQFYSRLHNCAYTSKLGTLEFTLGCIVSSVEATIFVRVIRGSWPDGFRGQFAAFTTGAHGTKTFCDKNAPSIDHEKIVLLDSRGEKVPVTGDGKIKLSRCVVSVEIRGELKVSVKAWKVDNNVVKKEKVFTPLKAGLSDDTLDIGFCKMEVNVAWSLISADPVLAESVL
ncbi:uncharacterized protein LOC133890498 [Phragmites australis]|uniref:uncharacterized protein LOC133890498 n=1 Tax=Phragmites australis TaxID=29695 RepID=UPI002D782B00|nr:uncharacterized protein LOC133890498 [Phragmites australis]